MPAVARTEPRSAQSLLPAVLAKLARETGNARPLAPVWRKAVGEPMGSRTAPVRIEAGTLHVCVPDRAWAEVLARQEAELRARMAGEIGDWLQRIVFFIGTPA